MMPGRLSEDMEKDGGRMDAGDAGSGSVIRKKHSESDDLAGTRRLPRQCPTPPTDPFPDLDSTLSIHGASNHREAAKNETRMDADGSGNPALLTETPTHGGVPLSQTNNNNNNTTAKSPQPDQHQFAGTTHAGALAKSRGQSTTRKASRESIRKLSASQIQALASAASSLPVAVVAAPQRKPNGAEYPLSASVIDDMTHSPMAEQLQDGIEMSIRVRNNSARSGGSLRPTDADFQRPSPSGRTLSSPPINRKPPPGAPMTAPLHNRRNSFNPLPKPAPLDFDNPPKPTQPNTKPTQARPTERERRETPPSTPLPPTIPLPPMSLPTHLQLELAGQRPSPLYIHHSQPDDAPYESSAVKFERLLNALLLPPYLEQIMYFGTLACFDAWLYTFTILPMRFLSALGELIKWWLYVIWKEIRWLISFVWSGIGRLWRRGRRGRNPSRDRGDVSQPPSDGERSQSRARGNSSQARQNGSVRRRNPSESHRSSVGEQSQLSTSGVFHPPKHAMPRPAHFRHRRTKSMPSNLTSFHKADLLQGAVLICSSIALSNLDASRMYHFIRAQSSMKLYVIYNILEVCFKLRYVIEFS